MSRHLSLEKRWRLTARINAALHFRTQDFPGESHEIACGILRMFLGTVDGTWNAHGSFGDRLKKLAENRSYSEGIDDRIELSDALALLRGELRRIDCETCAGERNRNACQGNEADHETVTHCGQCLGPVRDLLSTLHARCAEWYRVVSGRAIPVELATSDTKERDNQHLYDKFHLAGWCEPGERRKGAVTVGVSFRDKHFDLDDAYSLYYVFLHELLCHTFQGTQGDHWPEAADEYCPWSEGWMDVLAFEAGKGWLEDDRGKLPEWLLRDVAKVNETSAGIHAFRFTPSPWLDEPACQQRNRARVAFNNLRRAWSRGSSILDNRVALFSLRLNTVPMEARRRMTLGADLTSLLYAPKEPRFIKALRPCAEFADGVMTWQDFDGAINSLLQPA